jgi:phage shock protein E
MTRHSVNKHKPGLLIALFLVATCLHAADDLPRDAVWIDVRSPQEYASGHLPGATLIPFDGIEVGVSRLGLEKDTPIYLYCAVGGRAEVARQRLLAMDFRNVSNVGGLEDARRLRGELDKLAAGQ